MADRVVKVTLRAMVAEYNQGMQQAAAATRTVGTEAEKLAQKREAFQTLGRGLLVAGAAMVTATALTVRAAAQWESAWAGVTKTVDGTPEQLARVEEGLRGLSKVLPSSHDEIAAVAEAAGQLGVETDNIVSFTKVMLDLGQTTNLSAEQAAMSLAKFMNIMGTRQDDVSNLGSALVGLGNNFATTEADILAMSTRLSKSGVQIGLTEGEVLGLATALSSVGIEAEAGGSAMSKVMIDIASSVEAGGARLKQFARISGMSADEFSQKWRTAPGEALAAFVNGLANAESQGSSTLGVLADLGITEVRMRDALLGSAAASDKFAAAMAQGNEEFEKNNALTEEAAKRYETVESKIAIAGNAINDAAISFGDVLLPAVAAAADAVTGFADFMGGLPGPVQAAITVLAGAAGVIALVGGGALVAVPRIAAFKIAVETMKWSMTGISLAGGGVLIALTALVTVIGSVSAAQAQARQRAEQYADALRQGEDAARDYIAAQLAVEDSFMWMSRGTAVDNAKKLGLAVQDVTDAVTGSAAEYEAFEEKVWSAYKAAGSTLDAGYALEQLMNKVRELRGAQELAASTAEDTSEANEALGGSLGIAGGQVADFEAQVSDAEDALSQMNTALEDVGATALGMGDAVDRAQSAVNRLKDAGKDTKASIKGTNDESIRMRDAMRDVETSSREAAEQIIDNGESLEKAQKQYEKGREAVLKMLEAKGMDRAAAEKWADANLGAAEEAQQAIENYALAVEGVPEKKNLTFTVNTSDAESKLRTFIRTYDGKSITMTLNTNQVVVQGRVYGGLRDGRAGGGAIVGPGTGTSDDIPAWLSNGEHVLTAADVAAMGGQDKVYEWRRRLHVPALQFASGGGVSASTVAAWKTAQRRGLNRAAGVGGDGLSLVDQLLSISADIGGKAGAKLRAEALRSEKQYLKLEKEATKAEKALDKAKTKLTDLKDAASAMASRVTSAVRAFFDVGQLGAEKTHQEKTQKSMTIDGRVYSWESTSQVTQKATVGSIRSDMAASAARIKGFADKLGKLAKMGLAPGLLAEIASLGVENGEPVADALLNATKADISAINSSYAAIGKYSDAAGKTVADANFEKLIQQAETQVKSAKKNSDDIRKQLVKETDRIIKTITGSLTTAKKKSTGGPIVGPGSGTSDDIPTWLSNGEHVWTAAEVKAAGGHAAVASMRRAVLTRSTLTGRGSGGDSQAFAAAVAASFPREVGISGPVDLSDSTRRALARELAGIVRNDDRKGVAPVG